MSSKKEYWNKKRNVVAFRLTDVLKLRII